MASVTTVNSVSVIEATTADAFTDILDIGGDHVEELAPRFHKITTPVFVTGDGNSIDVIDRSVMFSSGAFIASDHRTFADPADFEGLHFQRCRVFLNQSFNSAYNTRYNTGTSFDNISKIYFNNIKFDNCHVSLTMEHTGNRAFLLLNHSVGDGLGACSFTNDAGDEVRRIQLGQHYNIVNTDFINQQEITFNTVTAATGGIAFVNVRLIGADTRLGLQGAVILDRTRFIDNTLTNTYIIDNYFGGGSGTSDRARACFLNMSYLIDGGVTSSNTDFETIRKRNQSNVTGTPMFFLNLYDFRSVDTTGSPIEDVTIRQFSQKGTGSATLETAMDFSYRYNGYTYDTTRYGDATDTSSAGNDLKDRVDDNFSLDGADELITDSEGRPIVSGETDSFLLEQRAVEVKWGENVLSRINFSDAFIHAGKFGLVPQKITLPLGYDTEEDATPRNLSTVFADDFSLTESDSSIIAAYTELDTPQKLYDYYRYNIYENLDDPDIDLDAISINGDSIDAGDYDITVDAAASSAFTIDADTITIHADTFTGNLITTGEITLSNGATVDGVIADTNGRRFRLDFPDETVFKGRYSSDLSDSDITPTEIDYTTIDGDNGYDIQIPVGDEVELAIKEPNKQPVYTTFTVTNTLFTFTSGAVDQPRDVSTDVSDFTDNFGIGYDTTTDDLTVTITVTADNDIHHHELYEDEGIAIFDFLQTQEAYLDMLLDQQSTTGKYIDIRADKVFISDNIELVFTLQDGATEPLIVQTSIEFETFDEDTNTPKNDEQHRVFFSRLNLTASTTDAILRKMDFLPVKDDVDGLPSAQAVINEWDKRHAKEIKKIGQNAQGAKSLAAKAKVAASA